MAQQEDRYGFVVEWFDKLSGYTNKYQLIYFPNDSSVEMYDIKNKRSFLKRSSVPNISMNDMFIGGTVTINSRVLNVVGFSDSVTESKLALHNEKVVGIVKNTEKLGNIFQFFKKEELAVTRMRMIRLSSSELAHLAKIGSNSYSGMKDGTFLVVEAQGKDSCKKWKWICADYNEMVRSTHAVGSTSHENALKEVNLLFDKREPIAYFSNCSLCLIKPHAVKSGYIGEIISAVLAEGTLEITALEMVRLTDAQANDFFIAYKGVLPEYLDIVAEMCAGPCIAMEIRSNSNVVDRLRTLCGPYDPVLARSIRPNSIRAIYGDTKVKNAVHCTDLAEDGVEEVWYFFDTPK